MAKERPEKTEKKERKEKKEKRSETDGVKKSKSKKEKKDSSPVAAPVAKVESKDVDMEDKEEKPRIIIPKEALVPFANPLADDKQMKKLLKSVKKAAKNKTLKRGVKEVVKSVRKLPAPSAPSSSTTSNPPGIVILAADISPMDVISHIPVLCEDHNIPYIYVTSRAELGAAGNTKRPTSVVMISKDKVKKAGAKEDKEGDQEYTEVYAELLKLAWPTLGHADESSAKRPHLRQRASSNLDPGVPVFIPNPQPYVRPIVLRPQTRRQEQEDPQYFHHQRHLSLQTSVPHSHTRPAVDGTRKSDHHLDPYQQGLATQPLSPFPFPINPNAIASVNTFHQAIDANVAAFFQGPNPFIDDQVKEPDTQKKIKQSSRAARWREKKAFEAGQKAQIEKSNIACYDNGEVVGHSHNLAPSNVDESELKFEEPLPPNTELTPVFRRADGSWVNTSAVHDDGRDRAAFELHHRVGLNRQQAHRKKAPMKPIARLMHEEIQERWFSNDRPVVCLNESMSGYAKRVGEMKDMSEQELELLMRDREVGMKVKEIALVYQGIQFPLQKEYYGDGVWR
ncbi:hypothetical protein EG328_007342 [Venturia inaequalis]|uniref:Ribosomal protein eL8/eL30/eS12/Gadd45 domain-containing protein n=1 Tax=Venturia inaequalis TaxID=5025 RepID=A0A8H3UDP1_VENIN|nr:hypothetical protein EG328_007342 [Venturia inaequalis]